MKATEKSGKREKNANTRFREQPYFSLRICEKNTGPGEVIFTAIATIIISGARAIRPKSAAKKSIARLIKSDQNRSGGRAKHEHWLGPEGIEDGACDRNAI